MKKLNILYKEDNKMLIDSVVIYINGKDYGDIKKNKVRPIELEPGTDEVVIYSAHITDIGINGASSEQVVWEKEIILIEENDVYYIFKAPLIMNKKGKLDKVTKENFNKILKRNQFWTSKTVVLILIIIGLIIKFLLN